MDKVTLYDRERDRTVDVDFHDDGFADDDLYLFGHEFGPTMLVRASGESAAWECFVDESPAIDPDDVPDAYGAFDKLCDWLESKGHVNDYALRSFATRWDKVYFGIATHDANYTGAWDNWDLIEGYEYQSNATGTGIVDVGHYVWMQKLSATSYDCPAELLADD